MTSNLDRRRFLRLAAAGAGAVALAGCGSGSDGAGAGASAGTDSDASSGPSGPSRKLKLGFIALTDAAPIIMAKELGIYAEHGLDVEVIKQASWPATRDNLLAGEIDGAHCLSTMPYSLGAGVGGSGTDLKIAMILSNNGQAITLNGDLSAAGYGDLDAAKDILDDRTPTMAMTFPGGTHDLWLRYWLRATGADESKIQIIAIPPAQMVENMTVGNMDGYCVGEPWNAVAVNDGIGFTHLATQDLWLHHPEKALVVNPKTAADEAVMTELIAATLEACKWLDDLDNRSEAADTIGGPNYLATPADGIRGRLLGKYELGADLGSKDFGGEQMMFFRDGATNAPRRSYGHWTLAQYQRLGLVKEAPPASMIDEIVLTDLYAKGAEAAGVDIPDDDMAPFEVVLDGVTFDPAKPEEEAKRR
ncbi:MAG TPA: CmpA/NrtA family ABC transporter substrate-binding protein [Acidimicrobiales bacterium]|nr:CmpA/NrtA family ABC transporter substrate-binding protein [Acidimicrobiales bacterium]